MIGSLWYWFGHQEYYVKITEDGQEIKYDDDLTEKRTTTVKKIYGYKLTAFSKNGDKKSIYMETHPDLNRPFKKNVYLKVMYSRYKKVIGYEEIKEKNVPRKALDELNKL